jgi:hypothetical protein
VSPECCNSFAELKQEFAEKSCNGPRSEMWLASCAQMPKFR